MTDICYYVSVSVSAFVLVSVCICYSFCVVVVFVYVSVLFRSSLSSDWLLSMFCYYSASVLFQELIYGILFCVFDYMNPFCFTSSVCSARFVMFTF